MSIRIPYNLRRFFTMYTYAFHQWLSFFYIYSFFGWIFESCYVSIKSRQLVNRGFLRLPMLPLYGTGAVMMLWVSLPLRDSIAAVYLAGTIAASILEYVTGYVMERLFKMKYWDYSHLRFQINGYVSLGSSLTWGLLTILLTEWVHRPISDFVLGLSPWIEFPVLAVLTVVFVLDAVQSTREALDLGRALEAMTKVGGPRCCKRTGRIAIAEAARYTRERFGVDMPVSQPRCEYYPQNRECLGRRCPFFPAEGE